MSILRGEDSGDGIFLKVCPMKFFLPILLALAPGLVPVAGAAALLGDRLDELHNDLLENRRAALPGLSDPFGIPDRARVVVEDQDPEVRRQMTGWRSNVVGTVFWIGEQPSQHNPVPNTMSSWDMNWQANWWKWIMHQASALAKPLHLFLISIADTALPAAPVNQIVAPT